MFSWVKIMITNDLVCEVHTFRVQNVSEENYNFKKIKCTWVLLNGTSS
jgi:hypothetical protein